MLILLTRLAAATVSSSCTFCVNQSSHQSVSFDLSALPLATFGDESSNIYTTSPCGCAASDVCPGDCSPVVQKDFACRGLGSLNTARISVANPSLGFNITMMGSNDPPCGQAPANPDGKRRLVYQFVCDKSVPANNPPEKVVLESPTCTYNVLWRSLSACTAKIGAAGACKATAPPAPAPIPCTTCLPKWKPTYDMKRSTVLMTCNNTGMHSVAEAVKYGVVVYDWSNAKQLWANAHPMNDDELLTKQAEMVLAADPGVRGYAPRVWVYR